MKNIKKIYLLFALFISFIFIFNVKAEQASSHPTVRYDGFNITEVNHARLNVSLKNVTESNISITGSDASKIHFGNWKNGSPGATSANNKPNIQAIYYHGPVNFGPNATTTAKTVLDAEIKIRFNNAATMYDGTKADVLLIINDIEFNVTALTNTSLSAESDYYMLIAGSWKNDNFALYSEMPHAVLLQDKTLVDLTDEERKVVESKSRVGNSYKVNVKVLKHGTNTAVDSQYSNLAFGAYDIDITDYTNTADVDGNGTITEAESILSGYDKSYSESIEFIKGFNSVVHLANEEPLEGYRTSEQAVVTTVTGAHNGVRIIPDGIKLTNPEIRNKYDAATYYSGFLTIADLQEFTFYWTGSACETLLFSSQDVPVKEIHNADGDVYTYSYGSKVSLTKIDEEETTEHLMFSTPTYSYAPKAGYLVKSVKVDDQEVPISSDYTYQFESLQYNPLVRLKSNGSPTTEPVGVIHKIEILYEPNKFTIVYENGGGTDGVANMPNQDGIYGSPITLQKNEYKKSNYKFADWKVYIEDLDGTRVEYKVNDKEVLLKDKDVVKDIPVPNGGKLVLVARWVNNPKTGDISQVMFISLWVALIVMFTAFIYYRKKYILK